MFVGLKLHRHSYEVPFLFIMQPCLSTNLVFMSGIISLHYSLKNWSSSACMLYEEYSTPLPFGAAKDEIHTFTR